MRKNKNDYKGIYSDMVEILGEEIVMKLHEHYRGQQITFPMKLYSNEYIEKYIVNNCRNKTLKEMCRDLGYTEGWIKQLLNKLNVSLWIGCFVVSLLIIGGIGKLLLGVLKWIIIIGIILAIVGFVASKVNGNQE